jgi:hypothetical protein
MMDFIAQRTNHVSQQSFGDIHRTTPMVSETATPISCLAKVADAAGVLTAGVGAGAIGYAVGHNNH